MAKSRSERLETLLRLQRQVKAMHEMRHAGFVAAAAAAEQEAAALIDAAQADESLHDLFPEIYARRIAAAYERRGRNRDLAGREALRVSTETARANRVEQSLTESQRQDDRARLEKDVLDAVERLLGQARPSRTE